MRVERHETEATKWEVASRDPRAELRPYLLGAPEGWTQVRGQPNSLREVPFPGVPLILNLDTPWEIEGPPKTAAQVVRFDRAVAALGSSTSRGLAEVALDCGYFDQAHLNRDFRELAGTTPTAFLRSQSDSGGIAP